ncbi:MAG: hypothetical protein V1824_04020 [archaeon]
MSLKDIYYRLEDKYFQFLDFLDSKGIKIYKVIDPLEKKGIPTFAVFSIIILALITLGIFAIVNSNSDKILPTGASVIFYDEKQTVLANKSIGLTIGDENKIIRTDEQGIYVFENLEKNKDYELKIKDSTYTCETSQLINLSNNKNYKMYLTKKIAGITKTILFKNKITETQINSDLLVAVGCSNDSSYYKDNITVKGGQLILDDVPAACGELQVYLSSSDFDYINAEKLSADSTTGEVFLSEVENRESGNLRVTIVDSESQKGINGLVVNLVNATSGITSETGSTNENGIIDFTASFGNYYVFVNDPSSVYGEIGEGDYTNNLIEKVVIAKNTTTSKNISLKKDVIGYISFKVNDNQTKQSIANVAVSLYKNGNLVSTNYTNVDGQVTFGVKENVSYKAVFDNKDYIVSEKNYSISSNVQIVNLTRLDQTNIKGVLVSVVDQAALPVELANLKVISVESNNVVKTAVADIKGQAIITNLDSNKTYYIEAIVGQYTGKSTTFIAKDREAVNVTVTMNIGDGTYLLNILDSSGAPLSTRIDVYDSLTNLVMDSKTTSSDSQGNAVIRIRADKKVYFGLDNFGSSFFTSKYNSPANNSLKLTINLPKISSTSGLTFLGFYSQAGEEVTSIAPGSQIRARFLWTVVGGSTSALAHFRTGGGERCDNLTHLAEEDFIYISNINYAGSSVIGGTKYTPCLGNQIDKLSQTTKDAKWFNIQLDKPRSGSYLVELDLAILDGAKSVESLYYRSEQTSGTTIKRNPIDTELGSASSTSRKESLYAYALEIPVFTGSSNYCNGSVCYNFSIYDTTVKQSREVSDKYTGKEANTYKLFFKLNLQKAISNATLNIFNDGSTIKLEDYLISNAGATISGEDNFDNITLGNLKANDHISGEVVFTILDSETDNLNFNLQAGAENVLAKQISIDVIKSKNMELNILPKTIIPFVANNVIVGLTDDTNKAVTNAYISVKLDSQTIVNGVTDKSGIFSFTLPASDAGSILEISAKKIGYRQLVFSKAIDEKILEATPEELELVIDLSKGYSEDLSTILINNSTLELSIDSITTSLDSQYATVSATPESREINSGEEIGINVKAEITTEGQDLMVEKTIKGSLNVKVNSSKYNKTWIIIIPVVIRITFGNSLDSLNCLVIEPTSKDIRLTSEGKSEVALKLINNCAINYEDVTIGRVDAQLNWNDSSQLGSFTIVLNNKNYELLAGSKVKILDKMDKGQEINLKLIFNSNKIAKGLANAQIKFTSTKPTISSIDKLEAIFTSNIIINDYTKCITTTEGVIPVMACSCGGYGGINNLYQNNFSGFNPGYSQVDATTGTNQYENYSGSGYANYQLSTLYQQNYPNVMYDTQLNFNNMLDPYSQGFSNQYSGLGNSNYGNDMFNCPSSRVKITNNCLEDVDIKLEPDYGLTINNDSEFSLEKKESKDIKIQGNDRLGFFKMEILAKPFEADSEYTLAKELQLQVLRTQKTIPQNCLFLSKKKFDFTGLKDGYQDLDIINKCYEDGYQLQEIKIKDIENLKIDGIIFLQLGNDLGVVEPIAKEVLSTSENKRVEVWRLKLRRDPEIQKKVLESIGDISVSEGITKIKKLSEELYNTVNLDVIISVGYLTPNLGYGTQYKDFPINLKDNLKLAGYLDAIFGSKTLGIDTNATVAAEGNEETPIDKEHPTGDLTTQGSDDIYSQDLLDAKNNLPVKDETKESTIAESCFDSYGFKKNSGFTGEANYEKYGLDRLLFNWQYDKITEWTCDLGNYYCDQSQLYMTISKKAWYIYKYETGLGYESKESAKLGDIYFLAEDLKSKNVNDKGYKIKDLEQLHNTDFATWADVTSYPTIDLQKEINGRLQYGKSVDEYLTESKKVIEAVPTALRDITIIDISSTTNQNTSFDLTEPEIKSAFNDVVAFKQYYDMEINKLFTGSATAIGENTYNLKKDNKIVVNIYKENGDTHYQFTVNEYLRVFDTILATENAIGDSAQKLKFNLFITQYINSMKISYGIGLNKFVANLKPMTTPYDTTYNLAIFKDTMPAIEKFLNKNSVVSLDIRKYNVQEPGIYVISLGSTAKPNTITKKLDINITVDKITDALDNTSVLNEFRTTDDLLYEKNILFWIPLNPVYYTYQDSGKQIPFFRDNEYMGLIDAGANLIKVNYLDNYGSEFDIMKNGNLFNLKREKFGTNKGKLNISFGNLRPIRVISEDSDLRYRLAYPTLLSDRITDKEIIGSGNKDYSWMQGASGDVKYCRYDKTKKYYYFPSSNGNNNYRTTFFALSDKQTSSVDYQLKIKSSSNLAFSYEDIYLNSNYDSDVVQYVYNIPSTIDLSQVVDNSNIKGDLGIVEELIAEVRGGNICFNVTNTDPNGIGEASFWINPVIVKGFLDSDKDNSSQENK